MPLFAGTKSHSHTFLSCRHRVTLYGTHLFICNFVSIGDTETISAIITTATVVSKHFFLIFSCHVIKKYPKSIHTCLHTICNKLFSLHCQPDQNLLLYMHEIRTHYVFHFFSDVEYIPEFQAGTFNLIEFPRSLYRCCWRRIVTQGRES